MVGRGSLDAIGGVGWVGAQNFSGLGYNAARQIQRKRILSE